MKATNETKDTKDTNFSDWLSFFINSDEIVFIGNESDIHLSIDRRHLWCHQQILDLSYYTNISTPQWRRGFITILSPNPNRNPKYIIYIKIKPRIRINLLPPIFKTVFLRILRERKQIIFNVFKTSLYFKPSPRPPAQTAINYDSG